MHVVTSPSYDLHNVKFKPFVKSKNGEVKASIGLRFTLKQFLC